MTAEQAAALADFARACKAAARAVSLYPGAHPAIEASLGRLVSAAKVLTRGADALLVVHPTAILDRRPRGRRGPTPASANWRRCCTAA